MSRATQLEDARVSGYDNGKADGKRIGHATGHGLGHAEGYRDGYKAAEEIGQRAAERAKTEAHIDARTALFADNFPLTPSHLDALDLVIEAFGLHDQYPSQTKPLGVGTYYTRRGAQRFYEDLQKAAQFRALDEADDRILAARTTAATTAFNN